MEATKRRNAGKMFRRYWQLYLLLLLPLAYVVIFKYLPMFGLQIAFKDYRFDKGIGGSEWVGLKHFMTFFTSYQFSRLMLNTIGLSMYALIAGFLPPILFAVSLNYCRRKWVGKSVQMITYLPYFISTVLWVSIVMQFLSANGIINTLITDLGADRIDFMNKPEYFKTIYVISGIVQGLGYGAIVYLAALAGVSVELYEAATIDGASIWQRIWHIDLPSIVPTAVVMLILRTSNILSVGFEKVYLMQNPLNMSSSDVIATYVYNIGMLNMQYSFSTAIGFMQSFVSLILVLIVNKISKTLTESSLF
jgi:putative aldouronate transport system permease protein